MRLAFFQEHATCQRMAYRQLVRFGLLLLAFPGVAKETIDACRRAYPELLSRVDRELEPWAAEGISRAQLDNLYSCPGNDGRRRFVGFFASVRSGKLGIEQARNRPMKRNMHLTMMLQSVAASFELPDVDFVMLTADHPEQGFSKMSKVPVDSHFNRSSAPLLLAYRKQQDNGTVAAPDWTFWSSKSGSEHYAPVLPSIDEAAALIRAEAALHPWAERDPRLFFMGANAHGDERSKVWQLARDEPGWAWVGVSNVQAAGSAKYGVNLEKTRPDLFFNETTLPEHCKFKYLLNLAGNAASSRFKVRNHARLLHAWLSIALHQYLVDFVLRVVFLRAVLVLLRQRRRVSSAFRRQRWRRSRQRVRGILVPSREAGGSLCCPTHGNRLTRYDIRAPRQRRCGSHNRPSRRCLGRP